jgi:hypothetical protein
MFHHPPNKVLRSILTTKEDERGRACTNKEKQGVVTSIIEEAWALGFDFCRWDSDRECYVKYDCPGGNEALRAAVAVALRDNTKRNRARKRCLTTIACDGPIYSDVLGAGPTFTNQDHHVPSFPGDQRSPCGLNFCGLKPPPSNSS